MADPAVISPNWTLEVAKIAVPVVLGAIVWAGQLLAQRAWTAYEQRRDVYLEVIKLIDSLFLTTSTPAYRAEYLQAVRKTWLVGSDEVVLAGNRLSEAIRIGRSGEYEALYRAFIAAMRHDLNRRKWLPPGRTILTELNFPLEGPGR
ncbi:hypothetical protein [Paraburkholderia sp. GAS334]|uniref:hypothetical protein n=1 Tax=Paraburkholderia sp. GAS334 TaxID=3035131 RepID=UPI003D25409D